MGLVAINSKGQYAQVSEKLGFIDDKDCVFWGKLDDATFIVDSVNVKHKLRKWGAVGFLQAEETRTVTLVGDRKDEA